MSNDKNQLGLSRYIPVDVAKAVRRKCGFGCVVCGSAIYDYEHFKPEFKDAKFHDSSGIVLLCPTHHRAKGGFISPKTLEKCAKAPFCMSSGFSHTEMDIDDLTITIGPIIAERCLTALEVKSVFFIDKVLIGSKAVHWLPSYIKNVVTKSIWFGPPEEKGAPLRFNMLVNGPNHSKLIWIEDNTWHGSINNFDIELSSGKEKSKIRVATSSGVAILDMEFTPPNQIKIKQFFSYYGNKTVKIVGDENGGLVTVNGVEVLHGSYIYSGQSVVALSL